MMPQEFINFYDPHKYIKDGYIYAEVQKTMYGLLQAGKLSNDELTKHLTKYYYFPCPLTPGLWKHSTRYLTFTLIVDDFGAKYRNQSDAEHLLNALQKKYENNTDWTGLRYAGVTLDWDYNARHLTTNLPGYVLKALQQFQHKLRKQQDSSYPWTSVSYGTNTNLIQHKTTEPILQQNTQKL